eukprot:8846622-Pyramimonas_sp.AAC.1
MRHPDPVQRFVAPHGAPLKAPVATPACATPTQYSVAWRRPQWHRPHATPPPSTPFRGPIGSSTEGTSGTARMRHSHPVQRFVAP